MEGSSPTLRRAGQRRIGTTSELGHERRVLLERRRRFGFDKRLQNAARSPSGSFCGSTYCSSSEPGKNFVNAETYLARGAGFDAKVTF